VRVELGTISEDLRQHVLTAIAHELELDEAERRRSGAGPPIGTGAGPANGASASLASGSGAGLAGGSGPVSESSEAASLAGRYGVSPANGTSATTENGSGAGPDIGSGTVQAGQRAGGGLDYGTSADPVYVSPWEPNAPWPGTPAQPGDIAQGEAADLGYGAAEEAAAVPEPGVTAEREEAIDAADAADGRDDADLGPQVPLPRRAPGTHGAPPPPAELRREYLPESLLGRRLDPEAHTEPLPRISAAWPGSGPGGPGGPGGPADTGSGQSAPSVFTPIPRAAAPPGPAAPAGPAAPDGSPAEPGPSAPVPSAAGSAGAPADIGASSAEAEPPETVPPDSAPPRSAASAAAIAAASAPTMPVGSAALRAAASAPAMPAGTAAMAAASAPTMPAGSAAMAAAAGFAPPAETDQTGADLPPPADLATASASPADRAAPPLVTSQAPPPPLPAPATSAQSRPPAASLPAPSGYGWAADPGDPRPRTGRGAGPPLPAALPAGKRLERSGRPYRIAGVILAIVALLVAAVIALVLSGGNSSGHHSGLGPPSRGAGALVRKRVAAWVTGQVSRTAVVACDPVMCQVLMARGVAESRLYQLGPQTTSPLRSQIIVATAAVRAQFGNVLSSVYAPAVLASFGAGADRIDVRATAPHGAAAYRAMLGSDLASRKASGAQLLHSGRVVAAALARHELAEGEVDGRLLIAIAQMAAAHPMFIVDFGSPAPGADPDMPLRQADLAEDVHPHHHAGHAISAGYVRAMVSFLRAQHGPFRPARVQSVHLPDGAAVLRIEFTAPSPLGLLGPHA
jgi:hypothetical protein